MLISSIRKNEERLLSYSIFLNDWVFHLIPILPILLKSIDRVTFLLKIVNSSSNPSQPQPISSIHLVKNLHGVVGPPITQEIEQEGALAHILQIRFPHTSCRDPKVNLPHFNHLDRCPSRAFHVHSAIVAHSFLPVIGKLK